MNYEKEDLLNKYKDKNFIEIISELTDEVKHLDRINQNKKAFKITSDYQFTEYRDYAGGFLYFLNTGGKPAGNVLNFFLPVITNLVNKGQLKKEVLELINE